MINGEVSDNDPARVQWWTPAWLFECLTVVCALGKVDVGRGPGVFRFTHDLAAPPAGMRGTPPGPLFPAAEAYCDVRVRPPEDGRAVAQSGAAAFPWLNHPFSRGPEGSISWARAFFGPNNPDGLWLSAARPDANWFQDGPLRTPPGRVFWFRVRIHYDWGGDRNAAGQPIRVKDDGTIETMREDGTGHGSILASAGPKGAALLAALAYWRPKLGTLR